MPPASATEPCLHWIARRLSECKDRVFQNENSAANLLWQCHTLAPHQAVIRPVVQPGKADKDGGIGIALEKNRATRRVAPTMA